MDENAYEAPRKRRWWRFSLRTLFVVVTVGAIASYVFTQRPRYEVIGSISADEARAVYEELLRTFPELKDERNLVIESNVPGTATVTTSLPEGWGSGGIKGKLRGVFGMLRYEWATGEVAWRSKGVLVSKWDSDDSGNEDSWIHGQLQGLVDAGVKVPASATSLNRRSDGRE